MSPSETMTDDDYSDFVAERFESAQRQQSEPVVFTNRGNIHAQTVLGHLINAAQKSLDIYTGCLSAAVYRPEALRTKARALGRGKTRVVIGDGLPFSEISVLTYLQSEIDEGFIVPRLGNFSAERIQKLNHFAIADKISLRVESNHAEKTAVVILNAHLLTPPDASFKKSLAASYCELFEELYQASSAYKERAAA